MPLPCVAMAAQGIPCSRTFEQVMRTLLACLVLASWNLDAASLEEVAPVVSIADIQRLDEGDGIDVDRTVISDGRGNGWIVYEHTDEAFTRSELRGVRFQRCGAKCIDFSAPARLTVDGPSGFVSAPSLLADEHGSWLYYVEAEAFRTPARMRRARWDSGELSGFEDVQVAGSLTAWNRPWVVASEAGGYALIQRTQGSTEVLRSADGKQFTAPEAVADKTGSTPAIAQFPDGRWVVAFQHGPMAKKRSYFRISLSANSEQGEWSPRQLVFDESDNVHNTWPTRRSDGRMDLYFLSPPAGWRGFAIHRRCLDASGALGPVSRVVPHEVGNLLEPHVARIAPDLLLLTFNEHRTGHRLHAAPLADDAFCPQGSP